MEKIINELVKRAKLNLKNRDENLKLAVQEKEAHHWKSAQMYEGFSDMYQQAFMEDVTLYCKVMDLGWMDACRELHRKADELC